MHPAHHEDKPITAEEFKKALHSEMRDMLWTLLPRYYEDLQMSEDVEERRKGIAMLLSTVGAGPDVKQDANANLPVFQFNFNSSGGMTATQLPPVEMADETPQLPTLEIDMSGFTPSTKMKAMAHINTDLDDVLGAFDAFDASNNPC